MVTTEKKKKTTTLKALWIIMEFKLKMFCAFLILLLGEEI